ncbi:MAG: MinD/ParA family ATP-binding protein [Candidatus Binatia bacterium]
MSQIVSIHSYRGGTGKSNITANLAALIAARNRRVGVVDTDIQSPGIHILFSLSDSNMHHSLNDYLWGKCRVKETAHDVTARLAPNMGGRIFLMPSSMGRVLDDAHKSAYICALLRRGAYGAYEHRLRRKAFGRGHGANESQNQERGDPPRTP